MRSFKSQFFFTALVFILSGLHILNDANWFGVFSALLMFFLGLIQVLISLIYVLKGQDWRRFFLVHLFLSVILVITLMLNGGIDIDDFANFSDDPFLLRIAPGLIAIFFLYTLYRRPKRADE